MLEKLFAFPIVMIDGDEELKRVKRSLSSETEEEDDLSTVFIGEAELPYDDFLGAIDRWGADPESKEKAKKGIYDHCTVIFDKGGTYTVPWSKKKFKEKIALFEKKLKNAS